MLLKMFVMIALVILPILIPINFVQGIGGDEVQGLDRLAWTNVRPSHTQRYWAHLLLALTVIFTFCYLCYDELRKYIRLRQAYLTSPQHRLKASATTVLVSAIPNSWLTMQRLVELYDVFPGGIRNVWINRDFDDLQEKVEERDALAIRLERAETELIRLCKKKQLKALAKAAKTDPRAAADKQAAEAASEEFVAGPGLSSGNPHQIPTLLRHISHHGKDKARKDSTAHNAITAVPIVGNVVTGVGKGIMGVGRGVGRGVRGGMSAVTGGVRKITGIDRHSDSEDSSSSSDSSSSESSDDEHHKYHGDHAQILEKKKKKKKKKRPTTGAHQNSNRSTKRGSTLVGDDGSPIVHDRTPARSRAATMEISPDLAEKHDDKEIKFWHRKTHGGHSKRESDELPLSLQSPRSNTFTDFTETITKVFKPKAKEEYPCSYNAQYDNDEGDGEPVWKKYITEKERPRHNLPLFSWMPSLPLIGKSVDTIYYCRRELARLNLEIEIDQETPERYPLMNSAFVQFNQQVAAHMACQCVSHHVPQHMCPRHIEVNPNDVIWGNMKMQWWERYIRSVLIIGATGGLIVGWAFPVAFVGLISQVNYLTDTFKWLHWLDDLPDSVLGLISGVLPPVLLGILMAILPMMLRLFARIQGCHTGMAIERSVQGMYFAFLFIQVFLVVSISSGITAVIEEISNQPFAAPEILAQNLPKASNFFFSYLLLQAFSVGGAALVQIATLITNFLLAPIIDSTARDKFTRATALMEIKWGTFFPVYTNLACIGIVYSIISPLILVFNMITFSLFWIVYRYNLLFVVNFRFDTGGLLFPRAINQLFTGVYVMEVCLVGLFFLVRDSQDTVACAPHALIMIVTTICTIVYQFTLNQAFGPLYTYLPITLEDDAVIRDEEFAKEQDERRRKNLLGKKEQTGENLNDLLEARERAEEEGENLNDLLKARERAEEEGGTSGIELKEIEKPPRRPTLEDAETGGSGSIPNEAVELFQDIADEIEDLTTEERDALVARAFQHPAIRAKRPVIWIPRDDLGVSDDEIRRTMKFSEKVWISNEYAGLDRKGRVRYSRSPPDFDMRDLVEL
jgi:hypothetical protein